MLYGVTKDPWQFDELKLAHRAACHSCSTSYLTERADLTGTGFRFDKQIQNRPSLGSSARTCQVNYARALRLRLMIRID